MGMSQMCTGAGDYFKTSKPHSEKLCNNTVNICAPLRHKKVCSTEIVPRLCPCWLLAQGPALLVHYKSGPGWAGCTPHSATIMPRLIISTQLVKAQQQTQ